MMNTIAIIAAFGFVAWIAWRLAKHIDSLEDRIARLERQIGIEPL